MLEPLGIELHCLTVCCILFAFFFFATFLRTMILHFLRAEQEQSSRVICNKDPDPLVPLGDLHLTSKSSDTQDFEAQLRTESEDLDRGLQNDVQVSHPLLRGTE